MGKHILIGFFPLWYMVCFWQCLLFVEAISHCIILDRSWEGRLVCCPDVFFFRWSSVVLLLLCFAADLCSFVCIACFAFFVFACCFVWLCFVLYVVACACCACFVFAVCVGYLLLFAVLCSGICAMLCAGVLLLLLLLLMPSLTTLIIVLNLLDMLMLEILLVLETFKKVDLNRTSTWQINNNNMYTYIYICWYVNI